MDHTTASATAHLSVAVHEVTKAGVVRFKQLGCINTISFTSEIAAGIQEAQEKLAPYLFPCIVGKKTVVHASFIDLIFF